MDPFCYLCTFVEIDHEIISTAILLLPLIHSRRVVVSYKRKHVHEILVNRLFKPAQEKVWLGELTVSQWPLLLTWDVKQQKQTNKQTNKCFVSVMLTCLFIAALCSPTGTWLAYWLSCMWCFLVFFLFLMWCPGWGVVLDCTDSWSLPFFLL